MEHPPYPYEKTGRCAGCGQSDVRLTRQGLPDVYFYRCDACQSGHSPACIAYKTHVARFGGQMGSCVPECPAGER